LCCARARESDKGQSRRRGSGHREATHAIFEARTGRAAHHASVDEHLDELTAGHDKLWDEINRVIAQLAKLGLIGRLLLAKLLEELVDVERRRRAAIVVVAVEVQHLLAGDREEAGEEALLHAGAEHDGIPLLGERGLPVVHGRRVKQVQAVHADADKKARR